VGTALWNPGPCPAAAAAQRHARSAHRNGERADRVRPAGSRTRPPQARTSCEGQFARPAPVSPASWPSRTEAAGPERLNRSVSMRRRPIA